MKAIDYSAGAPDPRAISAAGFQAVLRYITRFHNAPKAIRPAERAALHAAGIGIGIVYEDGGKDALGRGDAGRRHGAIGAGRARELGFPTSLPIFWAIDFDPAPSEVPVCVDYVLAASESSGHTPGAYANAAVCHALAARGVAHLWQHDWGGGTFDGRHIHQHGGQLSVDGVQCDRNDIYVSDCFWWPADPPSTDWLEEVTMGLDTIDLRNADTASVGGKLVDNLQGLLKALRWAPGDPGVIDGSAGAGTKNAVGNFQDLASLDRDYVVGPNTWRALITW